MTLKEIHQKIIDLLAADTTIAIAADHWFYGPPLHRDETPFGFVRLVGGPLSVIAFGKKKWLQDFEVVMVESSNVEDVAEKAIEDKIDAARLTLDSNNTLGGLAQDADVVSITADVAFSGTDWGHIENIIAAGKLVYQVQFLGDLR